MQLINYKPHYDFENLLTKFFKDDFLLSENKYSAKTNIYEEEDKFVLRMELPGYSEKEIDIKVEDNKLNILAKKEESKEDNKKYLIKEFTHNKVFRSFKLPKSTNDSKIEAKYKDGILNVIIPKSEKIKPKKIEIKT